MLTKIVVWHLQMTDPAELRPSSRTPANFTVAQAAVPSPSFSRFLYTAVGGVWHWSDRLPWTWDQWMVWLDRPELETWVGYVRGTPAGYTELERQADGSVEIAYFGLLPQFTGQGLGGALLTAAIRRGWEMDARRVWVHTCSLDHPHALANYQARGLRLFHTDRLWRELGETPGPWPGAGAPMPGDLPGSPHLPGS